MKKYYKFAGCMTCLFQLVGIVFYIILMVMKFKAGVDWITTFFLIYGLVGIVCVGTFIVNALFALGCKDHTRCCCYRENRE